jgi:thiol-disulfide isomerase/thioredoxin
MKQIIAQKIIAVLLLLFSMGLNAQKIAINFMNGDWDSVMQQAIEQNKLIFVDVYADYCPPCKQMDAQVFTNKEVAVFYNKNFINYKVNLSNRENHAFQTLHSIKELPALLYFTPDGRVMRKTTGCKEVEEFLEIGSEIAYNTNEGVSLVANDYENVKLMQLEEVYNRHTITGMPTSPETLRELSYALRQRRRPYNAVVNDYLLANSKTPRKPEVRQFIYDFSINLENLAMDYFLKDIVYFKQYYSGNKVNDKIKTAIYNSVLTAIQSRNENLFKKAVSAIQKANLPDEDRYLFEIRSIYYQGIEDWSSFSKVAYNYLTTQKSSDPQLLNDVAFKFQRYVTNKRMLKEAIKWAKKSINMEHEYMNHYALALLYFKTGKNAKALDVCKEAIDVAKTRNIPYTEVSDLMNQIHGSRY